MFFDKAVHLFIKYMNYAPAVILSAVAEDPPTVYAWLKVPLPAYRESHTVHIKQARYLDEKHQLSVGDINLN